MKTKLITLLALSWTMLASAQTFLAGTNALAQGNWWGADTNFTGALALSPTNEDANTLKAVTRLLVLPQTSAGSNFLVNLGFPKTNHYTRGSEIASLPKDANGEPEFGGPGNQTYNSASIIAFFRTNILTAVTNSAANLANVTDPNYTLTLSSNETGIEAVTLDYGDIQMVRAILSAMQFYGYTLNANNFQVVMPTVESLIENNGFSFQTLLSDYPNLLTINSAADLTSSEGALTNAIANYFAASAFIRNRSSSATNRLFELDTNDIGKEAKLRTQLTNVLASLNTPTEFNTNKISSTVYAGAYFAGTHSLNSLLPQFNGDTYVNDTLPDYTFGGILPYQPAYKTESLLRKEFHSYAGIYMGNLTDDFGYDGGVFAVFVSTNGQATFMGFDIGDNNPNDNSAFGAVAQFNVNKGNWSYTSNNVSGNGYIDKSGDLNGEVDGLTNGQGNTGISVYLNGNEQQAVGPYQNAAGNYSGTYSGTSVSHGAISGTTAAVLSADGQMLFVVFKNGVPNDAAQCQLVGSSNPSYTVTTVSGSVVTGTLTNATLEIGGTFGYTNNGVVEDSGTYTLTRSANVPFDTPPVITKDLLSSTNVALGPNVTFFLSATGSPPIGYQWYFNGNAIPGATTNTLVVSNQLWTTTGQYSISASVNNATYGTNSQTTVVTVSGETSAPTVAITNIIPGMLVSNSAFTVMGTAGDSVAVSNVFVSVNSGAFAQATTSNNWASWSAPVMLAAGTNTVHAYSVNNGNVDSAISNAPIVYVLSATLVVQTNGLGSISPNLNGASLAIGNTYLLTATAGTGFAFTNWSGGTNGTLSVLTNAPALQFAMQSNLVLQANFVDTNKPVVAITNITAGMLVSNSVFNAMGWATDNVAVAGVYVSLSNAVVNTSYVLAGTTNNWATWSTNVTLIPGTNTVRAYAVDTSGNISATNSVNLVYILSATLVVQTNGLGSISPNLNGASLAIGNTYLLTATAGTGFAFTNWTGGTNGTLSLLTNGVALQFAMQSNLVLQANFVDTNKPVVAITNITAGMLVSNSVVPVMGWATDNVAVAGVYVSLSNAVVNTPFVLAGTTNNWATWNTNVTLIPGTNTVRAYAVDTSGNVSATNSVNLVYILSATLTVNTNGFGTVSPNYNGQLLQIGQGYTMTATAGTGFMFTNWTGSITTNSPTLFFTMASNLTFTANFVDTNKPVVAITNITAGMLVSNPVFNVMGWATDNVAVAGVYVSLSNAVVNTSYVLAGTLNNWATWSTNVTLIPGTNTVRAYAVDTSGNVSATNSVNLVYILSASLVVQTNGLGSISPNLNGASLQIGNTYLLTATAGTGSVFTNWTGGTNGTLSVLTNGVALQFTMQSNLVLQANFLDVQPPVLAITNVTAGMLVSNSAFNVMGWATDNVAVASVYYSLTNSAGIGAWMLATGTNNWIAAVTLIPGTNTVRAYAVDTSGNISPTNSVTFVYILSATLTVKTNGVGTITPNLNGQSLAIGTTFSVTATTNAGAGFAFTNWSGGTNGTLVVLTNGPTLQFTMASNLVLQANFVDVQKPVVSITSPTNLMSVSNAVFTATGTATDNLAVASVFYSLNNGVWTNAAGTNNWTAVLNLVSGTNTLAAYAVDTTGNISTTNSVIFNAVLSTPLTVHTNGSGSVSPNYNGVSLQIGQTYSMTATAGTGFAFTNWTGSQTTNGATLTFTMASNLTFTANFVDVQPPVVAITNVIAGMQVSNVAFTVMGWATDNVAVAGVFFSLSNAVVNTPFGLATTANNWANWSTNVTLTAGTNTFAAYAVDTSGNKSATNRVSIVLAFQITTTSLPMGTNGFPYNAALNVLGGQPPFTWTNITGTLQAGLTLATNGVISGTPSVAATNSITFQVTDNLGSTLSQALTLIITNAPPLRIATTSLPNGTNGVVYSQSLIATGGHPPYTWTKAAGTLPLGLALATNGIISGTPTTNGSSSFTVQVKDAVAASAVKPLTLLVNTNSSPIHPVLNSASFFTGGQFQIQFTGIAGQNYTLQMSTNLSSTNWLSILITNAPGGPLSITDPNATNAGRFYRIMLGP